MNSLARIFRVPIFRGPAIVGLLLVIVILVAGCAPNAENALISPGLGQQLVIAQSAGAIEIEPTPEPLKLADLSDEEIYANLDPAIVDQIVNADVAQGETIALTFGCVGCHVLDPNQTMTGPTWYNMGDTAVARVSGESAAEYLYQSIVAPNAYVVPGYPANIMPANFNDTMSQEQIATMVAYLLAQHGN